MQTNTKLASFENAVLPHLDAAHNLARWLLHNQTDAEDVVQEAVLRAFRYFGGFRQGTDGRPWLLGIVRNSCYTWMQQNRAKELQVPLDDSPDPQSTEPDPEARLMQNLDRQLVRQAVQELPLEFREIIVLRELEGLSYREISAISDIPIGTVMSRLARARRRLQQSLTRSMKTEVRS